MSRSAYCLASQSITLTLHFYLSKILFLLCWTLKVYSVLLQSAEEMFPLLELPFPALENIAKLLPDIKALVSWKLTCRLMRDLIDKKKTAIGFARHKNKQLQIGLWGDDNWIRFVYESSSRGDKTAESERMWNMNDPDENTNRTSDKTLAFGR